MNRRWKQRLALGAAVAVLGAMAGCGADATQAGPQAASSGGTGQPVVAWAVQSGHSDSYTQGAQRWSEAHPDMPVEVQLMPNADYKSKIRVALGAGQGPDLIYSWGGGDLKDYIAHGYVEPLDEYLDEHPDLFNRFLPSIMEPVIVDGQHYGVPIANVQPSVLFYNRSVFSDAGAQPPTSWNDLTQLVDTFNSRDVAPLTVAGQSKWPYLPYVSYLVDRIGGPEVVQRIVAGEPEAWSDPAVLEALTMIQDLVKAEGLTSDYASLAYETGAADARLYTGKAAMMLMLASAYGNMAKANPEFVSSGQLQAAPFPTVEGGKGDPSNLTGNPSGFWVLNAKSSPEKKAAAVQFLAEEVENEKWADEIIERGGIPPVQGVESRLAGDDKKFQQFIYQLTKDAKNFQMSWDQALSPAQGEAVNTQLDRIFLLDITPQQFADEMNKTLNK